jgi:hypothetical protein
MISCVCEIWKAWWGGERGSVAASPIDSYAVNGSPLTHFSISLKSCWLPRWSCGPWFAQMDIDKTPTVVMSVLIRSVKTRRYRSPMLAASDAVSFFSVSPLCTLTVPNNRAAPGVNTSTVGEECKGRNGTKAELGADVQRRSALGEVNESSKQH